MSNPWLSIWTSPRKTIRHIIETAPVRKTFLLAVVFGLQYLLSFYHALLAQGTFVNPYLMIGALVFSPLLGYILLNIGSFVFYMVGKLFKGKAPFSHIYASVAWSIVPFIVNVVLWLCFFVFFTFDISLFDSIYYLIFTLIVGYVIPIWSFILLVNCLKEVQEYSIWRAVSTVVLPVIVLYLFAIVLDYALV